MHGIFSRDCRIAIPILGLIPRIFDLAQNENADQGGPSQFHTPWVQHISSTQKGQSFSTPKISQFHTKHPSVSHQKPLGSTSKTPQFNFKKPSVPHQKPLGSTSKTPQTKNSGVELRGFWCRTEGFWCSTEGLRCWTEGFLVLNWGISGAEKVWSWCWTDMLNWGGLCGTEGYSIKEYFFSNQTLIQTYRFYS